MTLAAALGTAATPAAAATPEMGRSTPGDQAPVGSRLVPQPASVTALPGPAFTLDDRTRIVVREPAGRSSRSVHQVADYLAGLLRPSTGLALPVTERPAGAADAIVLETSGAPALGREGYHLVSTAAGVRLQARDAEGLFRGVQTLRQLLPAQIEARTRQSRQWTVPSVDVRDRPRFAWRGTMLDVSRHFFSVAEVKRYIDLASMYKLNVLHLHLSDDQGWRIALDSWPRLASYGGSTEVGGGPGGHYTKADYREIVAYAGAHYMTVVPEIDGPGHTNAALASYADLNCDGTAPPLYTGTSVGFSSLCIAKDLTYTFYDDVMRELAAMTPGAYIHMGGDEAHSTPHADYVTFVERAQKIIASHDKKVVGWQEIGDTTLQPGTLAQYWGTGDQRSADLVEEAVAKGARVVMSPANRAYLDMKYDESTPLGLHWAGYTSVAKSYGWDPATTVPGVGEKDIAGVEAPIWSETLDEISDVEFMAFPRLAGIAEIGWSPASTHSWDGYRTRLGAQGARWDILGVNYYQAPEIDWSHAGHPAD